MKKKFAFVAAVLLAGQLPAQDSSQFKNLNEVTVTATRTEKKVAEVPRSITVFTSRDLEQLPYQNVADLLSRSEGIYANGTFQTPGSLQYLYLRGADARQTLIMIDGVKMSDAATPDNSLDLSEISLANVERIEIVRGSQGTLYGSSAIGGTINIITKKDQQNGWKGRLRSQNGVFGEKTFGSNNLVGLGYKNAGGWYVNADYYNSLNNGLNATINNGTNTGGYKWDERDNAFKHDISAKTGFLKKDWDVYFGYRKVQQKTDIDNGAFQDDENHLIHYARDFYNYGLSKKFNDAFSLKMYGGYTNTDRKDDNDSSLISKNPNTYDGTVSHGRYTGRYWSNEAQLNWKNGNVAFVAGAGITAEKMNVHSTIFVRSFNYTSTTNYDTLGIKANAAFGYARAEWKLPLEDGKFVSLAGGFRLTHYNQFGNFLSYELNPFVKVSPNTLLFINYSRGINAPSLYQRFTPEADWSSGITRGNHLLKPEESFTVEAGFKTLVENMVTINLSVYHFEVKNYIDYVYLWNQSKPVSQLDFNDYRGDTYLNLGTMVSTGFELGTGIAFSPKLSFNTNLSINIGKLVYDPAGINSVKTQSNYVQLYSNGKFLTAKSEQKELARRPTSLLNLNLTYKPVQQLRLLVDARGVGSRPDIYYDPALGPFGALGRNSVEGFTLFNFAVYYGFSSHVSANVQLDNIFNKKYLEINGFNTRGRSIWLGLNCSF